jgi:putative GTP pyrophosphokinase
MNQVLEHDGLSIDILNQLSYESRLNINLRKNLHYFDQQLLFAEIEEVNNWYSRNAVLCTLTLDYRIKSIQSAQFKYLRYYPDHQARKVFDDLLGFRSLCDNYEVLSDFADSDHFRIADMSNGKSKDDGYRGVHVYYQMTGHSYPIELQYNTYYDRQLNNWLHKYLYKKDYPNEIGRLLRALYEAGRIRNENEFKEALDDVLSHCERRK